MSVKDMLRSMDSMEYSRWQAYEKAFGPLGGEWNAEMIASIHEELQTISYLLGQAHFTDKRHPRGPIQKPERVPRPYESQGKPKSSVDEFDDEDEWLPLTEDELVEIPIDSTETGEEE